MATSGSARRVTLTLDLPEPMPFQLDPRRTAVVVVDMQQFFLRPEYSPRARLIVGGNVRLLAKARTAGAPVIYVQSVHDESSLFTTRFGQPPFLLEGSDDTAIVDEVAPRPDEPVVHKSSHDPWTDDGLQKALSDNGIRPEDGTVLVTGISTAVCVHATVLGLSNRHFMTVVPLDCTAARTVEDEARAYAHMTSGPYAYNIAFTDSTMVDFRVDAPSPELQLRRARDPEHSGV